MRIAGEEAARWQAVRRDSLETVNRGPLLLADDETGLVEWKDGSGEPKRVTLGPGAIKLMGAYPRGR